MEQMKLVAGWIDQILNCAGNEQTIEAVHKQVLELCRQFPVPNYNL